MYLRSSSLTPPPGFDRFAHPLLAHWCESAVSRPMEEWPDCTALEILRREAERGDGIARPRFSAQTRALLDDGLHYEARIATRGELATREHNPHDFFNALVWLRHPRLKWALNARQVADIAQVGPKRRTRGQCALTHFDEAGAIVWLADTALLPLWDAHDWSALFRANRASWGRAIAITVFGHALAEHVWNGHELPVAKALAVAVPSGALAAQATGDAAMLSCWPAAESHVAAAIADGILLADPQDLRPLPLAGIPGWHPLGAEERFLREAPCFRPVRAGRRYPPPFSWRSG